MDMLDKIIAYEGGEMDTEDTIDFFQELIDNGMAWTLQGHYGRTAKELIERGLCKLPSAARAALRKGANIAPKKKEKLKSGDISYSVYSSEGGKCL